MIRKFSVPERKKGNDNPMLLISKDHHGAHVFPSEVLGHYWLFFVDRARVGIQSSEHAEAAGDESKK